MTSTDDASGREKQRGQLLRQTGETNNATSPTTIEITCPPLPPGQLNSIARFFSERGPKSHISRHPQ